MGFFLKPSRARSRASRTQTAASSWESGSNAVCSAAPRLKRMRARRSLNGVKNISDYLLKISTALSAYERQELSQNPFREAPDRAVRRRVCGPLALDAREDHSERAGAPAALQLRNGNPEGRRHLTAKRKFARRFTLAEDVILGGRDGDEGRDGDARHESALRNDRCESSDDFAARVEFESDLLECFSDRRRQ